MKVRKPAVAGMFYPASDLELARVMAPLFEGARTPGWTHTAPKMSRPTASGPPKALIVPHAGYIYSGLTAAYAYLTLDRPEPSRVVLLGPCHAVAVRGLALPGADVFATPLGDVRIDAELVATVAQLPQVITSAEAHAWEHSLEVQLPFLLAVLDEFTLLPLAVGAATPEEVADVLDAVWGGPETLIVISSDLSHYLPYDIAAEVDAATVGQILRLDGPIDHDQACGATPVNGMLVAAARHNLVPELLDLRNSGDTAGDPDRVVGYAAIAFREAK